MGAGGANFQPSQQSSQSYGSPRMGGKGGSMGGRYAPSRQQFGPPNMGGKGGGMRGGFDDSGMGGYGSQGGFRGFGPQQPPQFSPDTMNQMNAYQQLVQGFPQAQQPQAQQPQAQQPQAQQPQAQQQMPNMGGKGGPQQLPQGMGGYMQQQLASPRVLDRYAMRQAPSEYPTQQSALSGLGSLMSGFRGF